MYVDNWEVCHPDCLSTGEQLHVWSNYYTMVYKTSAVWSVTTFYDGRTKLC